jgi:hypothetical protein
MTTRLWTKMQTQQTVKALRQAGYVVNRTNDMYKCELDGENVFTAMLGYKGYMVRYNPKLFGEEGEG